MKKVFIVTPSNVGIINIYSWFFFAKNIEEVEAKFPDCSVEEAK
jgi:hypothetical protein